MTEKKSLGSKVVIKGRTFTVIGLVMVAIVAVGLARLAGWW